MNRETALAALVSEVMQWHADPRSSDYNDCDKDKCMWCENAAAALALQSSAEGWQAISSAPAAEEILGYFDNGEVHVGGIDGETNTWYRQMDEQAWTMPTHWRPLPEHPQDD